MSKRVLQILLIIYSTALIILGLFSARTLYLSFDPLINHVFEEIVTKDVWNLNVIVLILSSFSSGVVGLILAILLWKGKEGIERVWLIFITWQFALTLIQKGSYVIGEPDKYEILIVGIVFIFSWFALFPKITIPNNSKATRNAIKLLTCTVFCQLLAILVITGKVDPVANNFSEAELEKIAEESFASSLRDKFMNELHGEHYEKYSEFYELFEQRELGQIKEAGNYLLRNGYENDRFILSVFASEAYSRGDHKETDRLLNAALDGDYPSELAKPDERISLFEDAQLHYMLHLVNQDLNEDEKSQIQYELAEKLLKRFYKDNFTKESLERAKKIGYDSLNHFNN